MRSSIFILVLFISACGFFFTGGTEAQSPLTGTVPKVTPPPMKLNDPLPANLFVELAKAINPAIVNISTSAIPKSRQRDPMQDLFEQFYGIRPRNLPQDNKPVKMALGTGFIIREDGLIVTNNHVVAGADLIQVQLSEKSEKLYDAQLIGADERSDIALIKIKPDSKLTVAALGSSKDLEVGEWVAAFGNPFGHGHTMTKGIVSALSREISEINKNPLIQTDASINPGNSGGPLVNTKGYVIGVNSAIDARAQGIGFAIPIDEVKKLIPELETRGRVRKGYIGAGLADLNEDAAEYLGMKEAAGAVIQALEPGGPAAKGGLKVYDIVTEFNGKKIKSSTDLIDAVTDAPIGQSAKVKILRDRKEKVLEVSVAERKEPGLRSSSNTNKTEKKSEGLKAAHNLGFKVSNLNSSLREQFEIPDELNKPVITEIEDGSLASRVGLRVGDVVLEVNKKEITTAADVNSALKKGPNTLRLGRQGRLVILAFETP